MTRNTVTQYHVRKTLMSGYIGTLSGSVITLCSDPRLILHERKAC